MGLDAIAFDAVETTPRLFDDAILLGGAAREDVVTDDDTLSCGEGGVRRIVDEDDPGSSRHEPTTVVGDRVARDFAFGAATSEAVAVVADEGAVHDLMSRSPAFAT